MAVKACMLPKLGLHLAHYSAEVTKQDFDRHWEIVSACTDFDPSFDDLVVFGADTDLSGLDFEVVSCEAKRFVEANAVISEPGARCSVTVCPDNIQAMTLRLHYALIDENEPKVEKALFAVVEEACQWLNAAREKAGRGPAIDASDIQAAIAALCQAA
jgi:hypothetical protein